MSNTFNLWQFHGISPQRMKELRDLFQTWLSQSSSVTESIKKVRSFRYANQSERDMMLIYLGMYIDSNDRQHRDNILTNPEQAAMPEDDD